MAIRTTYTDARQRLAELWRLVEEDREPVIITRRGHEEVALVSADELARLQETAHLLRSLGSIEAVLRDPFSGIGKPERLKYLGGDVWSRRLTQEHRSVYLVRYDRVDFLQARYHY